MRRVLLDLYRIADPRQHRHICYRESLDINIKQTIQTGTKITQ
jgi:hypothetical protein